MFKQAPPELVRRYYPDYHPEDGGIHHTYMLETHLVDKVFWPLVDDYLRPGQVALDLGCGRGTTVRNLKARGARAIGVDLDDSGFSRSPGLDLVKADACDLPLDDASVDLVTSRWMFEHLEDPAAVAREILRVLQPGGTAVILTTNVLHPGMMLSRILPTGAKQWLLSRLDGIEEDWVLPTYYAANTERALDRCFGDLGFRKVGFVHASNPAYWLFSTTLFKLAMAAGRVADVLRLQRFRMQLIALYRKPKLSEPASPDETVAAGDARG